MAQLGGGRGQGGGARVSQPGLDCCDRRCPILIYERDTRCPVLARAIRDVRYWPTRAIRDVRY
eukprot:1202149-Rhodomonas_salina.2